MVGLLAALTAGFGYAVYAVVTKRLILRGLQATVASAWQFSIGALVLLPFLAGEPMGWLRTPSGLAMALWLGVAATGVAYLLYGYGLRSLDTATATTLTLAEPVTAAMFAMVVLDERLSPIEWVGAAIVLARAGARRGPTTLAVVARVSFAKAIQRHAACPARRGHRRHVAGCARRLLRASTRRPARTCSTSAARCASTSPCSSTTRSSLDREQLVRPDRRR